MAAQTITLVDPITAEVTFANPTPLKFLKVDKVHVTAGTCGIDNSPTKRYVPQYTTPTKKGGR